MNIRRCADCGNSPKNQFAEDLAVALLSGDEAGAQRALAPSASLEVVGLFRALGAAEILGRLTGGERLEIETVVTHGRAGAVSGRLVRAGQEARFALVLRFASAKADAVQQVEIYCPEPESLWPAPG